MILIGSKAIRYWFPDFPRTPKDTDYIIEKSSKSKESKTEYLINPIILDLYKNSNKKIISIDHLATLKASHLCWNINWEKHMWDLQFLLKNGAKIQEELFWKLYRYWERYHCKNKRSDLKMSKDKFFTNAVNYDTTSHDETHLIINKVPIYTKVLKDNCEVELDEEKYKNLSFEDKLNFVREEVYVMAYERFKNLNFKFAYNLMLKKFIISHTPLFSLIFILENFVELQRCKVNFIEIIENGRKN